MIVVVALGRRALAGSQPSADFAEPRGNVDVHHLAETVATIAERHDVVLTIAGDPESRGPTQPIEHVVRRSGECTEETGVSAGTYLATSLERHLRRRLPDRMMTTVLTQIAADPSDPALRSSALPIL